MKPFRWNLKKREQLGSLLNVTAEKAYDGYETQLADCAAKVVARTANKKIIFVGRSPENIFDYLSGVFEKTSHEPKLDILNISNRFRPITKIKNELPSAYNALKQHFLALDIAPSQIRAQQQGICFCDLVAEGGTFQGIFEFIQQWSLDDKCDFHAIVSKLGFIGITQKTKNSPNTWRWQQNANWVKEHTELMVKNVSIPELLWHYLGNCQAKVSKTNYPERWGNEAMLLPPREESNIQALKQAYEIYNLGREQSLLFANKLATLQEFREPWLRHVVNEIKRKSAD